MEIDDLIGKTVKIIDAGTEENYGPEYDYIKIEVGGEIIDIKTVGHGVNFGSSFEIEK